ncbi:class I SAM-dependent methyltransferase [Pedococcus soli]
MLNNHGEYRLPRVHLGKKRPRSYGGLLERADLGLHAQIASVVSANATPGARILDMGAGEGALAKRLRDRGFDVRAVDVDVEGFKAPGVPFEVLDFDDPAAVDGFINRNEGAFDVVLGIEVIEHVENQWSYARQLYRLLKPGGLMLVTTPNVTSWLSRATFLFRGRFHQFADEDVSYGHISPISAWELDLMLTRIGYHDVEIRSAGTLPPVFITGFNSVTLLSLLFLPLRPLLRGFLDGWCIMATARTPSAQEIP